MNINGKNILIKFFVMILTLLSCAKTNNDSMSMWLLASLLGSQNQIPSANEDDSEGVNSLTFSPQAGTYFSDQSVSIIPKISGSTICYTSDGVTIPICDSSQTCTSGNLYSASVSVTGVNGTNVSTTLKAIACKAQILNSDIAEALFSIATPRTLSISKAGTGTGTIISTPTGINCGTDCTEVYSHGTTVTLTAQPDSATLFAGWSGGGCSGTGQCSVTMNAATSVVATFNATLTVTKSGTGTGAITSSPAGINCGGDCVEAYPLSTFITLTANPGGSTFAGWSGGGCSGTGTCTLTLNVATTVNAIFN